MISSSGALVFSRCRASPTSIERPDRPLASGQSPRHRRCREIGSRQMRPSCRSVSFRCSSTVSGWTTRGIRRAGTTEKYLLHCRVAAPVGRDLRLRRRHYREGPQDLVDTSPLPSAPRAAISVISPSSSTMIVVSSWRSDISLTRRGGRLSRPI